MPEVILNNLRFDARPDRTDFRDREYLPPLRSLPSEFPSTAAVARYLLLYTRDDMILDQGQEGACTGFGLAALVNYLLWRDLRVVNGDEQSPPPAKVSERMLYHLARFYDEWESEDYDGSSCRGPVKGWHHHGVCAAELLSWKQYVPEPGKHPFGSEDLCAAVNAWVKFWGGAMPLTLQSDHSVFDGETKLQAAHGGFDNDLHVLTRTLDRILGGQPLIQPVTNLHGF